MTAIDRLIEMGQRRGRLEIDDIRQALPVDTMPTAELAEVLARLEEAGISIEIDPALLTGGHGKIIPGRAKSATEPPQHSESVIVNHSHLAVLRSSIKAAAWPAPGSEDTELGVFMGLEVRHGEAEVYARVQA
jgi:Sigma-70 factor, region 1.1